MSAPYSHSKLEVFKKCSLNYWYKYHCEQEGGNAGPPAAVGRGIHAFMEEYVNLLSARGLQTDWEKGREILQRTSMRFISPDIREDILEVGEKVISWYNHTAQSKVISERRIGVAKDLKASTSFDEAYLRGIIDRIEFIPESHNADGTVFIVQPIVADYKSGFKHTTDMNPAESLQLALYGLIAYRRIELDWQGIQESNSWKNAKLSTSIQLQVWNLRFTKIDHCFTTIMDLEKRVREEIMPIAEMIDAVTSEPETGNVSDLCAHCDYRYPCKTLNRGEGLERNIKDWLAKKEAISNLEKTIKAHVKKNGGTVLVEGKSFGFSESPSYSWDGRVVKDWLLENSGQPASVVETILDNSIHFNNEDFTRLCKKFGMSKEKSLEIAKTGSRAKFGFL